MLSVSTRSELAAKHGVAALVRKLHRSGVPAVVVEPSGPGVALNGTPEALAAVEPRVLACVGPATPDPDHPEAHLASSKAEERRAAAAALIAGEPWLVAGRCRRLLVPIGAPLTPVLDRAAHAEGLCRDLYAIGKRLDGVTLCLLPTSEKTCFLDPESADWILGELKGLRLAVDTGAVWAAANDGGPPLLEWFDRHASSLGFILLADHDGRRDGALLPGAGRGDVAGLRDVIGSSLPYAVRCDPRASFDDVLASATETERRLGPVGDPTAW